MKTSSDNVQDQVENQHPPVWVGWVGTYAEWKAMRQSSIQHSLGSPARHRRRRVSKFLKVTEIVWDIASVAVIGLVVGAVLAIYPF